MTATRREFIAAGAAGLAFGSAFWRSALAAGARAAESAYGPLQPADAHGLMLPPGFRSREIARAGRSVRGYPWHIFSDGRATFATPDGGWVLVSNSESLAVTGAGSSAIRFGPGGEIESAYRILGGTHANCAGGRTPWGTWLSCEEYEAGHVWECEPGRAGQGTMRPGMGSFSHEAVTVDPVHRRLYMTEDQGDGGLYRFTPTAYPDLTAGRLEVLLAGGGWAGSRTPRRSPRPRASRPRPCSASAAAKGSGSTPASSPSRPRANRIWAYGTTAGTLGTIYDRAATPDAPLSGVDNLTVSRAGEVFVCEDGGDMEICVIEPGGAVAPFLRLVGEAAEGLPDRGNELAGVVFDPSGDRLYFAAQRAYAFGAVYEVTGPFLQGTPAEAPVAAGAPPAAPSLRVKAQRRIGLAALRRRGLKVVVRLDEPADVRVALRTDDLRKVAGARGSTARPRTVTLDRRRQRSKRVLSVRLRLSAAEARRLRRAGEVTLHVAISVRGPRGFTRVASRRVRLR